MTEKKSKKRSRSTEKYETDEVGTTSRHLIGDKSRCQNDGVSEMIVNVRKKEKKKNKAKDNISDGGKVVGVSTRDNDADAFKNVEKKKKNKKKKEKSKNEHSIYSEVNEGKRNSVEETVSDLKSYKEGSRKSKNKKMIEDQDNDESKKKNDKDGKEFTTVGEDVEAIPREGSEWKKRKREKRESMRDGSGQQDSLTKVSNDGQHGDFSGKVDKKSKTLKTPKSKESNEKGDFSAVQQDNMLEDFIRAEDCSHSIVNYGNDMEKFDRKRKKEKKKKKKKKKKTTTETEEDISAVDSIDTKSSADLTANKTCDSALEGDNKRKKKKAKLLQDGPGGPKPDKSKKRVRFSGHVEVFHLPNDSDVRDEKSQDDDLVRGKRFTPEEDGIVRDAVYKYIEERDLGEEGLNMVLNASKYPQVKNCWKEIAKAIPYRPYLAIYNRAQVLFRRSETHTWTQEEFEMVLKYQQEHGNQWRPLADELGKHRWHVKDAWRRIRLPNKKKGHWSQEEYQALFDLVNLDLQQRVLQEKRSKHGMLRDNIPWMAISDKLTTRTHVTCCLKWYGQLTSSMVKEGVWADADDYRLVGALFSLDPSCVEDVDWDNLLDDRPGHVCRKRWNQMVLHIGQHASKSFSEQVEVLAQRYCPHLTEEREIWDRKPRVP